jgi:hypothetical protein
MDDLNFQQLSTVQNSSQLQPKTVTAAATIAPTTFLTFVTGTTNLATITPPVSGCHMLAMVFSTTALQVVTTGNILIGTTTVVIGVPVLFIYNPITAKYSVMRGAV